MASNGNPSHSQIWDDSSLVDSWNEALDEYKKYHSMKARGESAEQVLKEARNSSKRLDEDVHYEAGCLKNHPAQDHHAKKEASEETADLDITSHEDHVPVVERPEHSNRSPALPQHLVGQVHDEDLKNLLMSWYYAGYYTGLHEGKQTAKGDKLAKHES
ncbi:hypothetical protein ONS95_003812 [Cadophora gregata]|uniref:uncharacterized protein n=1 Tax=Cadophora gregata TaxID=51156 RepID=UPI0026DD965B|nr:uncharacterized protein ONS95_003812 [Cadophora gregata]KAK0107105.1 hypothetical protein ONS95_003812 [Cadophora gregata]KAK0116790.1 hypothetical protein ONS96_012640 [Cadophora gregata f. sp. sojae]